MDLGELVLKTINYFSAVDVNTKEDTSYDPEPSIGSIAYQTFRAGVRLAPLALLVKAGFDASTGDKRAALTNIGYAALIKTTEYLASNYKRIRNNFDQTKSELSIFADPIDD